MRSTFKYAVDPVVLATRLTNEELHDRWMWEGTSANANEQPDTQVQRMIQEIRERRAADVAKVSCR